MSTHTSAVRREEHIAAVVHQRPRRNGRTFFKSDTISMFLAVLCAVGTPLWFFLIEPAIAGREVPKHGWIWTIPVYIAFAYFIIQTLCLLVSAGGRSDDIGMKDSIVSLVTLLVVLGTMLVLIVMWVMDARTLHLFHFNTMVSLSLAAFLEFITTWWTRMIVNRRYFSGVPTGDSQ